MAQQRDSAISTAVGRVLRDARLTRGIAQQDLAGRCGVSYQQIQKYERGQSRITVDALMTLAQALEMSPQPFFDTMTQARPVDPDARSHRSLQNVHMLRAFQRIPDQNLRRHLILLARQMGSSTADGADIGDSTNDGDPREGAGATGSAGAAARASHERRVPGGVDRHAARGTRFREGIS